jgi:hypothetical protein
VLLTPDTVDPSADPVLETAPPAALTVFPAALEAVLPA